jgi:hypothetical protein
LSIKEIKEINRNMSMGETKMRRAKKRHGRSKFTTSDFNC